MWSESQQDTAARRRSLIQRALNDVVVRLATTTGDPDSLEENCAILRGLIARLDLEVFRIFDMMHGFRDEPLKTEAKSIAAEIERLLQ